LKSRTPPIELGKLHCAGVGDITPKRGNKAGRSEMGVGWSELSLCSPGPQLTHSVAPFPPRTYNKKSMACSWFALPFTGPPMEFSYALTFPASVTPLSRLSCDVSAALFGRFPHTYRRIMINKSGWNSQQVSFSGRLGNGGGNDGIWPPVVRAGL